MKQQLCLGYSQLKLASGTRNTNSKSYMQPYVHASIIYSNQDMAISWGFPGGAVVENPPANAGDTGLSPGPGRSHMPQSN